MRKILISIFGAINALSGCSAPCNCNSAGVVLCEMKDLKTAPKEYPKNVTTLSLNHNQLQKFSTKGLKTNYLEKLTLRNNSLTIFIDKERKRYPRLSELDLSMNNLRWVSMGLFQRMRNLQQLNLGHNDIISVSSIRIPPYVWNLDLSHNKIDQVPGHNFLASAKNLMELNLSNNKIRDLLPNTFSALPHLGVLNLDGNQLTQLRNNVFYGLKSCYNIGLRDNLINEILPKAFFNMGVEIRGGELARKIVDLRNNQIAIVLADWVSNLTGDKTFCETHSCPEPFELLLKSNPIYCDCNMQQVKDVYKSYFADLDETICVNKELNGTSVENYHDEACCTPQFV